MWEFVVGVYLWRCWTHPRTRSVRGGLNTDVLLPHRESLEFHHNEMSAMSQKVRACLGETGLRVRKIHYDLPSSPGGWATKTADFINNVNPAGTVPVLVHNGHPIYESHEQIVYIDQVGFLGNDRNFPIHISTLSAFILKCCRSLCQRMGPS